MHALSIQLYSIINDSVHRSYSRKYDVMADLAGVWSEALITEGKGSCGGGAPCAEPANWYTDLLL